MKKGSLIYKLRGPVYFHFCLFIIIFYFIFQNLKSGLIWMIPGIFLIFTGEFIRLWSASYIGTVGKAFNLNVKNLRTSGPYAYVRNPIYIGNFIWISGIAITAKLWFLIPYIFILLTFLYSKIIPREEKYLSDTFGDEYFKYCSHVNRLVPKLTRYEFAEKGAYNFLWGLKNEMHVLIYELIAIITVLILTYFRNGHSII